MHISKYTHTTIITISIHWKYRINYEHKNKFTNISRCDAHASNAELFVTSLFNTINIFISTAFASEAT